MPSSGICGMSAGLKPPPVVLSSVVVPELVPGSLLEPSVVVPGSVVSVAPVVIPVDAWVVAPVVGSPVVSSGPVVGWVDGPLGSSVDVVIWAPVVSVAPVTLLVEPPVEPSVSPGSPPQAGKQRSENNGRIECMRAAKCDHDRGLSTAVKGRQGGHREA